MQVHYYYINCNTQTTNWCALGKHRGLDLHFMAPMQVPLYVVAHAPSPPSVAHMLLAAIYTPHKCVAIYSYSNNYIPLFKLAIHELAIIILYPTFLNIANSHFVFETSSNVLIIYSWVAFILRLMWCVLQWMYTLYGYITISICSCYLATVTTYNILASLHQHLNTINFSDNSQ